MTKRLFLSLLICVALIFSCPLCVSAGIFKDVPDSSWYAKAVNYCYENGYMVGVSETSFGPERNMSRAMFVTILYRCAGEPAVLSLEEGDETEIGGIPSFGEEEGESEDVRVFPDVPTDTWYSDAVKWGVESGIVAGYEDGTFLPDKDVSRQEMVSLFYRYLDKMGLLPSGSLDQRIFDSFPDRSSVGNWAKTSVVFCTSKGLICGSNGKLLPNHSSTRAQVASMIMRLDDFLAGKMGTIVSSSGANGMVSPLGTFSLVQGASILFHFYPNSGYIVDKATLNGSSKGKVSSLSATAGSSTQKVVVTFKYHPGNPYSGYTQLVNRTYPLANASSYVPPNLTTVKYPASGRTVKMQSAAATALNDMIAACRSATGKTLYAQSGYRSYSYQTTLYNNQISKQGGNKYKAGTISAIPGTSEHQMGLAIDVSTDGNLGQSFGNTAQGKWLAANCYKYGYILRYPAGKERITGIIYEPWHFRYVGKEVATAMKNEGITTLEEYYGLYLNDKDLNPYLPYLK